MKKILVLVLALVLCLSVVFVACDKKGGDTTPQASEELTQAYDFLSSQFENKSTTTSADFALPGAVLGYNVSWSLVVTSGDPNGAKLETVDGVLTVVVAQKAETDINYTLTGSLTENGVTLSVVYNYTVPAFQAATWEDYVEACKANDSNVAITIKGYIVGVNAAPLSSSKGSLWVVDSRGYGYYVYMKSASNEYLGLDGTESNDQIREKLNEKFAVGKEVEVKGSVTKYGSTYEFNNGASVTFTGNSVESSAIPYRDATADFGAVVAGDTSNLEQYQSARVVVNGATMGIIDGKNYHFSVNGVDYICYMDYYLIDEATLNTLTAMWQLGGKMNIKGVCNVYGTAYQIYPDSAASIEPVQEVLTDEELVSRAASVLSVDGITASGNVTLPTAGEGAYAEVAISWALVGEPAGASLEGNVLSVELQSDASSLELVATLTKGDASTKKTLTVSVAASSKSFIALALEVGEELADRAQTEDSYVIIGTVSRIKEAYSEQYKNITFYVSDGSREILVYRYNLEDAATIAVGDAIAFAAPIKKYGSDIEAVATFVKLNVTSLADAAAAGVAGTGVAGTLIYGKVSAITTAYSEQYNNITITVSDGTNELSCYRLAGGADITVGAYILVTGKPSAHNGTPQMAAGATYTLSPVYVSPELSDVDKVAAAKAALTLKASYSADFTLPLVGAEDVVLSWAVVGETSAVVLGENGAVTVVRGAEDVTVTLCATLTSNDATDTKKFTFTVPSLSSVTTKKATFAYTGVGTTTNMIDGDANNASLVGLDAELWTVTCAKGGNAYAPGLNKAGDMRLYADKDTGNGNTVTVSISDGTIATITINFESGDAVCNIIVDGEVVEANADGSYTINAASFTIKNVCTGATTQVKINSIEITYVD